MAFSKKVKSVYVSMSVDELKKEIEKYEREYQSMIIQRAVKQPDNPMKIRNTRRLIALLKTILREKELGIRK
jgi:large subunit ribosomal protein L29